MVTDDTTLAKTFNEHKINIADRSRKKWYLIIQLIPAEIFYMVL